MRLLRTRGYDFYPSPLEPCPSAGLEIMDDHSIAAEDPQATEKVEQCLQNAAEFDLSTGYEETRRSASTGPPRAGREWSAWASPLLPQILLSRFSRAEV